MANQPITNKPPRISYTATAGQTLLPFNFWIQKSTDLDIWVNGSQLAANTITVGSQYLKNDNGGYALVATPLALNDAVVALRNTKIDRESGFGETGAASFKGEAINLELSRLIAMAQDAYLNLARKVGLSPTSNFSGSLAIPTPVANRGWKWNADATALISTTTDPDATSEDAIAAAAAAQASATAADASADAAAISETNASGSAASALASALAAAAAAATLVLPSMAGNALKFLRVNAGATALEWATAAINLTSIAEVLTGTDTAKAVTADALAALWEQGSSISSASTLAIPSSGGGYFAVTGTTTITAINQDAALKLGREIELVFAGALTLTHNATGLILPGGASITTAAGDVGRFRCIDASNNYWRCVGYTKASGQAVIVPSTPSGGLTGFQIFGSSGTYTRSANTTQAVVFVFGGCGASGNTNGSAGGSGGGCAVKKVTPDATETVTIGAGGAAGSLAGGGTSSFGAHCSATGGGAVGGSPGSGSGGTINLTGTTGQALGGSVAVAIPGSTPLIGTEGGNGHSGGNGYAGANGLIIVWEFT